MQIAHRHKHHFIWGMLQLSEACTQVAQHRFVETHQLLFSMAAPHQSVSQPRAVFRPSVPSQRHQQLRRGVGVSESHECRKYTGYMLRFQLLFRREADVLRL